MAPKKKKKSVGVGGREIRLSRLVHRERKKKFTYMSKESKEQR